MFVTLIRRLCKGLLPAILAAALPVQADIQPIVRVGVLDNSPPMAFVNAQGRRSGFSVGLMRLLCADLKLQCRFNSVLLEHAVEAVATGELDVAAVNLLDTPERRARVLMTRPVFRSQSFWLGPEGVSPGAAGLSVAVVQGSAQAAYAQAQGWRLLPVAANGDLAPALLKGEAQGALVPMPTVLGMMQQPGFEHLHLVPRAIGASELSGNACFAVAPARADLKAQLDAAIERVKRDGRYDRLNTEFLPFRIE